MHIDYEDADGKIVPRMKTHEVIEGAVERGLYIGYQRIESQSAFMSEKIICDTMLLSVMTELGRVMETDL